MYHTRRKGLKSVALLLAVVCALPLMAVLFGGALNTYAAEVQYYSDDNAYGGEGASYNADYKIYNDYKVEHDDFEVFTAPSYTDDNEEHSNYCAATAGANVVSFYDYYYENLIPNFFPGMYIGGTFVYYPHSRLPQVVTMIDTLYDLMEINVHAPGATEQDFKDGLTEYVEDQGYDISFTSFYKNKTTVNLDKLEDAISANKVGVIFLSEYNLVYGFTDYDGYTLVTKRNNLVGHMMMVYGYITVDYYKDNKKTTETYLQVSSGYSTAYQGYIKMDDFLEIDDALIVNIS